MAKAAKARARTAPKQESAVDIAKRTVILSLSFTGPGDRSKIDSDQIDIAGDTEKQTDKSWVSATKVLFESPEYDATGSLYGQIMKYIKNIALPGLLKGGLYLLPLELVDSTITRLNEYKVEMDALVQAFVAAYGASIEEARKRLGPLFNPADYVPAASIASHFSMKWRLIEFSTPASLEQINRDLYEVEKRKAEQDWAETRNAIKQMLRANMAELVAHMEERLAPGDGGRKKAFHKSAIPNFTAFLDVFDARNVTDDTQLKAIVDQAKQLLKGVSTEKVRDDETLRQTMHDNFAKLRKAIAPMIVEKPRRSISFEE